MRKNVGSRQGKQRSNTTHQTRDTTIGRDNGFRTLQIIILSAMVLFFAAPGDSLGQDEIDCEVEYQPICFNPFPDVPLSQEINDLIILQNAFKANSLRDMQEIDDGSGRFLGLIGANLVQMFSPGQSAAKYLQAGSADVSGTEGASSMALHPGFSDPESPGYGKLYTLTVDVTRTGDAEFPSPDDGAYSHSVITEWTQNDPSSDTFQGTSRELMRFDQGTRFHNVDQILFGPDEFLYIGVGDDNVLESSDDLTNAFGKILRIDPLGNNSSNGKYGIPADNPFIDEEGALPEIYAWGVRNPWRSRFDSVTGELFVADVSDHGPEEINRVELGGHYGWPHMAGTFLAGRPPTDDLPDPETGLTLAETENYLPPITQLDRSESNAIIGMVSYRGNRFPELQGKLIFASWNRYHVYAADPDTGDVVRIVDGDRLSEFMNESGGNSRVLSVNEDADGEIYLLGGDEIVAFQALPDFDRSGAYDLYDVDAMCAALGTRSSQQDLNGDLIVDEDDFNVLKDLANLLPGDVNVDGQVSFTDFLAISGNFSNTDALWSQGDLDCNGTVEFEDFLILSDDFGSSNQAVAAVPESATSKLLLSIVVMVFLLRGFLGLAQQRSAFEPARCPRRTV